MLNTPEADLVSFSQFPFLVGRIRAAQVEGVGILEVEFPFLVGRIRAIYLVTRLRPLT